MKTSFAVLALIYGASALTVDSAIAEAGQLCRPWCEMNAAEQKQCLADHTSNYTQTRRVAYKKFQKSFWRAKNALIKKLRRNKRKAAKRAAKKVWATDKSAWSKKYTATVGAEIKALLNGLKANKCEPETESETSEVTESETESETRVVTESETEEEPVEPKTKAVKVSQVCDGSWRRMVNEQTANLFEIAKKSKATYKDVSFPADRTSLYWSKAKYNDIAHRKEWNSDIKSWERAFEIKKNSKPASLWGAKGILPAGVKQGYLGNCWWVAVASALAEHPERIKKIFSNFDQAKGIYEFELWSQGKANKIVVDDRLPLDQYGDIQFGQQSENRAFWMPLLEKGAAKFFGTYEDLEGGLGNSAFQMLTGYPSRWVDHKNEYKGQKLLDLIKLTDDSHNVMWGGLRGSMYKEAEKMGFIPGHEYTYLAHTTWNGMDFVQVRNPWGGGEFKGKWSDFDTKNKQRKAFNAHVKNDGNNDDGKFWMSFSDFEKFFGDTSIGYYLDDYHHTTLQARITKDTQFTLNNPVKQHVYLQADGFMGKQFMDDKCKDDKRIGSGATVQMQGKSINLSSQSEVFGDNIEFKELKAGKYTISVRARTRNLSMGLLAHASLKPVTIVTK